MTDSQNHFENNIKRLIQVSYGQEIRPDSAARAAAFQRLSSELRGSRPVVVFPEWLVAALVGLLVFLAVLLVAQKQWPAIPLEANLPYLVEASVLFLNLAFIPFACLIIVIRRRYA